MENLIHTFFQYKINRLTEYGIILYQEDSAFLRKVFSRYFHTYVDNYYYGIYHTLDTSCYSDENLKEELQGMMVELLDDYRAFELDVSNDEYCYNQKRIRELKDFSYEIIKIDQLVFPSKGEIANVITDFISNNQYLSKYIKNQLNHLIGAVRVTYDRYNDLLVNYQDTYFSLFSRKFHQKDGYLYMDLHYQIDAFDIYKKGMVYKIFLDSKMNYNKVLCLIQKVSLFILKSFLNHEDIPKLFLEIPEDLLQNEDILSIIRNPLFRKYVIFGVSYDVFLNHRDLMSFSDQFACIQDFTDVEEIYDLVTAIHKDNYFQQLVVKNCKFEDRDFFLEYESDHLEIFVFEEE